ncbi:putative Metalloendopeptidase [Daphnia magna]|uniref:Putative Metalloendopeptidase n=1 Tax=Daphnia magna TaxID=35525 RepID=A0A162D5W2_9CRUS|nr:putative Metalloendopeptidase [Daphnia magna]
MFEGDISGIQSIKQLRNAIIGRNYRWPNAVIPDVISASFNLEGRSAIARALMEYHNKTCIRFLPRSIQPDYIVLIVLSKGNNNGTYKPKSS